MHEIRVKGEYVHHHEVHAAQGVKIAAQDLDGCFGGASLFVAKPEDDIEEIIDKVMEDLQSMLRSVDKDGNGMYVQVSTLHGSLEALLAFLKQGNIAVFCMGIGPRPIHRKDVVKASAMLDRKGEEQYAVMLAFADCSGGARRSREPRSPYFHCRYHLFDQFTAYPEQLKVAKKREAEQEVVFPCCRLKIVPGCVFNMKERIVIGVGVLDGILKSGTPLVIPVEKK
jgi:translation initiation factor 5B